MSIPTLTRPLHRGYWTFSLVHSHPKTFPAHCIRNTGISPSSIRIPTKKYSRPFFFFFFAVALRPQRPYGLLGTGAQDVHLAFHRATELWSRPLYHGYWTFSLVRSHPLFVSGVLDVFPCPFSSCNISRPLYLKCGRCVFH